MNVNEALTILEQITKFKAIKTSSGFLTLCPTHMDSSPSLGIAQSGDKLLLKCFTGGCSFIEILNAIKAHTTVSIWDSNSPHAKTFYEIPFWKREVVATYDYTDEFGNFLYQKSRFLPKSFAISHIVNGKKKWGMNGLRPVLYNLPQVVYSKYLLVIEGEKSVDNVRETWGLVGTTNFDGAGEKKWLPELYNPYLRGKHLILVPDCDAVGRSHMEFIYDSIKDEAESKVIVDLGLSEKQDIDDYMDLGYSLEDFRNLYKKFRKLK